MKLSFNVQEPLSANEEIYSPVVAVLKTDTDKIIIQVTLNNANDGITETESPESQKKLALAHINKVLGLSLVEGDNA